MMKKAFYLAALLVGLWVPGATAQPSMTVSPSYAFLSQSEPYATFTVANSGTEEVEITVKAEAGIISAVDSTLANVIAMGRTGELGDLSPYLRVFPNRLLLKPGESRPVRMMVANRGVLPRGGYAAIMRFEMNDRPAPAEQASDKVSMQVRFLYNLVAPVLYVSGTGEGSLEAAVAQATPEQTKVKLTIHGGFPFAGHVRLMSGDVQIGETDVSVYDSRYVEFGPLPEGARDLRLVVEKHYGGRYLDLMKAVTWPESVPVAFDPQVVVDTVSER